MQVLNIRQCALILGNEVVPEGGLHGHNLLLTQLKLGELVKTRWKSTPVILNIKLLVHALHVQRMKLQVVLTMPDVTFLLALQLLTKVLSFGICVR